MKLTSILIILLFAFTLAACGGGGSSSKPEIPMAYDVNLGDLMLEEGTEAGTHEIAAGESEDIGGITFTCPAGNACTLVIAADGTATSTGGHVTAAMIPVVVPPVAHVVDMSMLLEGYMVVEAGEYMIEAGMTEDVGHATFTCPDSGDACTVTVNEDGTATSTGGMATAMPSQMAIDDKMAADEAARLAELAAVENEVDISKLDEDYRTIPAGTTEIDAGESEDVGDAKFTCPDGPVGCSIVVTVETLTGDDGAVATRTTVVSKGGAATVSQSKNATDRIAAAKQEEADRMAAETARQAAKTEAMRVAGLIGPDATLADANTNDNTSDADTNPAPVSIVTIPVVAQDAVDNFSEPRFQTTAPDGADAGTDPDVANPKFMKSTKMPAMIDGWTRGTYTHTSKDGNTMHKVVKYSDKAADKDVAYSTFFQASTIVDGHRASVAVTSVTNGILTLDGDDVSGNHELFTGNFGSAPANGGSVGFTGATNITGSFRGVAGKFKCPTDCSSTFNKDGELTQLTGSWTFVPTVIDGLDATDETTGGGLEMITKAIKDLMVPGVMQDADYMIFGYWEQSVTVDGKTTETMLPFADGKRDYDITAGTSGTATYAGPATGLYMKKPLTTSGTVDQDGSWASGQFTANALLVAKFGGGSVAADDQFSITGTISDFMDGDTTIDEGWMVNLNRRKITVGGDTVSQKNIGGAPTGNAHGGTGSTFVGVTHGGAQHSAAGDWSGTFHGPAQSGTGDDLKNPHPASASGIFDAHFVNGHVRGAFAASKQAE